jgi:hypothetical protein
MLAVYAVVQWKLANAAPAVRKDDLAYAMD